MLAGSVLDKAGSAATCGDYFARTYEVTVKEKSSVLVMVLAGSVLKKAGLAAACRVYLARTYEVTVKEKSSVLVLVLAGSVLETAGSAAACRGYFTSFAKNLRGVVKISCRCEVEVNRFNSSDLIIED